MCDQKLTESPFSLLHDIKTKRIRKSQLKEDAAMQSSGLGTYGEKDLWKRWVLSLE